MAVPCVDIWNTSGVRRQFVAYVYLSGISILGDLVKYMIASSKIINIMTDSYMVMWDQVRSDIARLQRKVH